MCVDSFPKLFFTFLLLNISLWSFILIQNFAGNKNSKSELYFEIVLLVSWFFFSLTNEKCLVNYPAAAMQFVSKENIFCWREWRKFPLSAGCVEQAGCQHIAPVCCRIPVTGLRATISSCTQILFQVLIKNMSCIWILESLPKACRARISFPAGKICPEVLSNGTQQQQHSSMY